MTWLRGTTLWNTLPADLTRLICGEMADSQGVTVAAGDRWVRDFRKSVPDAVYTAGSSIVVSSSVGFKTDAYPAYISGASLAPGTVSSSAGGNSITVTPTPTVSGTGVDYFTDSIRTPASTNVDSGVMANRAGYFSNIGTGTANGLATPNATSCRVSAPYSAGPGAGNWWAARIVVNTANTVPGNYSNATASYWVYALNLNTTPSNGVAITINAAGVATAPAAGLQVTLSDPSGILTAGTTFVRTFSGNHWYGVDWWPMYHRAAGPATFGTPPPGIAGTDWEILDLTNQYGGHATSTGVAERDGLAIGLGVKTATGLGTDANNRYTVSWPMALGKCRIFAGGTNGTLSLDVGGSRRDQDNSVLRPTGIRLATWAKAFTTPGSVTAATSVQYLMSVTRDGIVLALNGDPLATGKISTSYYCAYQPTDPVFDKFPMCFNGFSTDYVTDHTYQTVFSPAHQYPYWSLRRRQDGTAEAVRDWQTGFMRCEHAYYSPSYNYSGSTLTDFSAMPVVGAGNYGVPPTFATPGVASYTTGSSPFTAPARQNKPGHDNRWWMYPIYLAEGDWTGNAAAATPDESRILRGKMRRFMFTPEDGFANWDEITDVGDGSKWLLLKPDYMGTGARIRTASSVFSGGVAIQEV